MKSSPSLASRAAATLVVVLIAFSLCIHLHAATLSLARDGKALLPITVSQRADAQTNHIATDLGVMLKRITDGAQGTLINWHDGMAMTIVSSQEQPAKLYGRWHLCF